MKQLNPLIGGGSAPVPSVPDGKTVTPINDVNIWLACASISSEYNTLAEVLNDPSVCCLLMANNNAVDYLVRCTEWIDKISIPAMTSNTTPSGVVTASGYRSGNEAWKAFDGSSSTYWLDSDSNSIDDAYIIYDFGKEVKILYADISGIGLIVSGSSPTVNAKLKIQGSNDGSTWTIWQNLYQYILLMDLQVLQLHKM